MKLIKFLSVFIIVLSLVSCETKKTPINKLSKLETELAKHSSEYTEEDCRRVEEELNQIDLELQKYEYTDEELEEIGKIKGRCAAKIYKAYFNSAINELDDCSKVIGGAVEGFFEGLESDE